MSEATNISPSPMPTISGEAPLRAKIRRSGASDEITPSANAPRTSVQRVAHRPRPDRRRIVFLEQMREHFGVGLARERVAFVDQLRAQAGVVLDDAVVHDGEFLRAVHMRMRVVIRGRPCVAQRVCPTPTCRAALRRWRGARPGARACLRPSSRRACRSASMTAMPAESYPRYSKRPSESIMMGTLSRSPM